MNLEFDPSRLLGILPEIGFGMLGIFAVTIVIIFVTSLFNKLMSKRNNKQ